MAFSAFPSSTTRQSRMFVGLVVCTIISLTFLILQYGIFGSGNFSAKYTPPLSSLSSSLAPSSSIQSSGSMRGSKGREIGNRDASTCEWKSGDPVLLQIRNMNHVHYDAGHWFHMSENIMVQHSKLRQRNLLVDNQRIFYNFDTANFIGALNAVTRFVTYLGTALSGTSSIKSLVFMSSPAFWKDDMQPGDTFLVSKSEIMSLNSQYIPLLSVPTHERFAKTQTGREYFGDFENTDSICVKYIDTIGGHPEKRGKWFVKDGDIDTMRQKIRDVCPFDEDLGTKINRGEREGIVNVNSLHGKSKDRDKKYRLVIYQRDQNRRLSNEADVLTALQSYRSLENWNFQVVMHSTSRSPCELSHILNDVDVLVTPHGFQSILLIFLPRTSLLFEIYPFRYYKPAYAPMSIEFGVMHGKVMSPPTRWDTSLILRHLETSTCFKYKSCRSYARSQDVVLDQDRIDMLVDAINRDLLPRISGSNHGKDSNSEIKENGVECFRRDKVYS